MEKEEKIYFYSLLRVNLPLEALPATVLEMDESDQGVDNQQRKLKSGKYDSEAYEDRVMALRTKKKAKEALSPIAKSEDLVDEELAKMEQAESLRGTSENV